MINKNYRVKYLVFVFIFFTLFSCQNSENIDLIIVNGEYYTATGDNQIEAIAIKDGKIFKLGNRDDVLSLKTDDTKVIDAHTQFVMPGIIEGHGHFCGMGASLQNLNFLQDTSWSDIEEKVKQKIANTPKGEWIIGRGWHQEKWFSAPEENYGAYPTHNSISNFTPDNPVILFHASGHSLFANQKAMTEVGYNIESPDPKGGKIIKNDNGTLVGVFEERAMRPFKDAIEEYINSLNEEEQMEVWLEAVDLAQQECLKNGVTSFQDAGLKFFELDRMEKLAEEGKLDIRLWVMLRERAEKIQGKAGQYRKIGLGNNFYTCRAIKSEIDGALGAHGAWLLQPYEDKKDFYGQNTTDIADVETIAKIAYDNDMQLCVHAIGDRANKETLDIIEKYSKSTDKNLRWRVEHAQHLNPNDINRFKSTGAIASMQGIHCTSDAPFVVKRLGSMRAKVGAYAWKALLDQGVVIVNGTDVPVEKIDPFQNFYASVTRKRIDNGMAFFVEQRMTREQALRSYTLDAAYGAFEEDLKGSLEVGKFADITILDTNLLTCGDQEIPDTKVIYTIVDGEVKYSSL
ncbi:MAG: amidohydrolase [Saprospiraceae bacterium]|nr:amidohydrolase [Saprospiraceae bacterium]